MGEIMPREDRQIIFSYEETYKAIYALCTQKEMRKPPPGAISVIKSHPDVEKKMVFQIDNHQDNSSHQVEYNSDFLAAALMLFCRSQSIPISKIAKKSVELKNSNVILRLVI